MVIYELPYFQNLMGTIPLMVIFTTAKSCLYNDPSIAQLRLSWIKSVMAKRVFYLPSLTCSDC